MMIERIAKELASDRCSYTWENMAELWQEVFRTEARRLVAAMREPTEAMMHAAMAAVRQEIENGRPGVSFYPKAMYQAMIDAALKEQDE